MQFIQSKFNFDLDDLPSLSFKQLALVSYHPDSTSQDILLAQQEVSNRRKSLEAKLFKSKKSTDDEVIDTTLHGFSLIPKFDNVASYFYTEPPKKRTTKSIIVNDELPWIDSVLSQPLPLPLASTSTPSTSPHFIADSSIRIKSPNKLVNNSRSLKMALSSIAPLPVVTKKRNIDEVAEVEVESSSNKSRIPKFSVPSPSSSLASSIFGSSIRPTPNTSIPLSIPTGPRIPTPSSSSSSAPSRLPPKAPRRTNTGELRNLSLSDYEPYLLPRSIPVTPKLSFKFQLSIIAFLRYSANPKLWSRASPSFWIPTNFSNVIKGMLDRSPNMKVVGELGRMEIGEFRAPAAIDILKWRATQEVMNEIWGIKDVTLEHVAWLKFMAPLPIRGISESRFFPFFPHSFPKTQI